jgi:cytochrome c556
MRTAAIVAAALSIAATAATAEPIEDRQNVMKERASIMRVLGPIAQERQPFDAATVMDALEQLNTNAQQSVANFDALWPEGSGSGDTKAAPAIWEDMDGFRAASEKFAVDAAAAAEAAPQDLAAFQAVFGTVAGNCVSCHEKYRLE